MDKDIFEHGLQGAREIKGARFFDETMIHPKATAIDTPRFIEFDWEALTRHLGEAREELGDADYKLLAQVMSEFAALGCERQQAGDDRAAGCDAGVDCESRFVWRWTKRRPACASRWLPQGDAVRGCC